MSVAVFMGQGASAQDGKGRFALPALFRNPLQQQVSSEGSPLIRAIDGCDYLTIFGDLQAPEFLKKLQEKATDNQEAMLGDCWSGIQPSSVDAGGRFALPALQAQVADITDVR